MFRLVPILFALALATPALANPTPKPLFARTLGNPAHRLPVQDDLVIQADGSFVANGRDGRLSPASLTELERAIAKTRFVLAPPPRITCTALPTRHIRIQTRRGTVSWSAPCARGPHASVLALDQLASRLVAEHTVAPAEPLVAYRVMKYSSLDGGVSITIRHDGSWTSTANPAATTGALTPAQLQALRDRMKTVRVAGSPKRVVCTGRLDGHGSITLDGVGAHKWTVPCADLDPSLHAFIAHLHTLTR